MSWKVKGWVLVGVMLAVTAGSATAQIATTSVTDTVYRADGTAATGTVLVSWQAFTTALGQSVPSGSASATITGGGAMSIALVPNAGATPMGSYYTAVYHLDDGTVSREFWVVPASQYPVEVSAIKSSVLPTSVAMQTVSKSYVDTAIATAVAGHPLDSSNPYVLKSGDTMTGALQLPGDPLTAAEAADKHYVDTAISAVAGGVGQKVSQTPAGSQIVTQPTGTNLEVNKLNGVVYAGQYVSPSGNDGIANALAGPDCAGGCDIDVEPSYLFSEGYTPSTWNSSTTSGTHVEDRREGARRDSYFNPIAIPGGGLDAGQVLDVESTRSTSDIFQRSHNGSPSYFGMLITHEGLTGGSNLYPATIESVPYFKSNYAALNIQGTYNTMGQHVLAPKSINCFGIGDCMIGAQFIISSGGLRDEADEGTHPMDVQVQEDTRVFQGTCSTGCTAGSTTLKVAVSSSPGTQGEGRFLIDKNPADVITTGQLTGGTPTVNATPGATVSFSGTSFPVSVFFQTSQTIRSQANNVAPGAVTVALATSGVFAGYATDTSAAPAPSGVACVVDQPNSSNPHNYEMANYTVVDSTHLQMTLQKVHRAGATIAIGGLCGYGLEQTADTVNGIRQVFPVIGSYSATQLYYAAGVTAIVGVNGQTSAFLNVNASIASIARSGNVVTVTTAGNLPVDVNGLTLTVTGVADSSYNGSFVVTTTAANTLTYTNAGANSTSSGGSVGIVTGGYALYPMAEVLGVYDQTAKTIDGQLTLAPNTVPWAANDPVEEPHYYQERISADTTFVTQTMPRPTLAQTAGIQFLSTAGPGLSGWQIKNGVPASNYLGNGGTHTVPYAAYLSAGLWQTTMDAQAGERSVFAVHCNSHGCGKWSSAYDLFELDSLTSVDKINFQPMTSALTINLRGTTYGFTPQAFTAGTINATTINATTLNGTVGASQLPVFVGSGSSHAPGAVPDPGSTAGATRYLREDGTWSVPAGGVSNTAAPVNMPERANLLGEYLLNEGSGSVADDTSGLGHNGVIAGANWEGKADLNFTATGQYLQLPTALNAAKSWQFAIYAPPFGTGAQPQAPGYGNPSSFGTNPALLCGTDAQHLCLIAGLDGQMDSMKFQAYTTDQTEAAEPLTAGWHIVTLLCGSNVGGVVTKTHLLYDGAEVGGYIHQGDAGTCPSPSTGNYQIGGSSTLSGSWFLGKVAAAWAWSAPLSVSEGAAAASSALNYIRAKGVQTDFHSVVHATPVIVGGLDSRTSGVQLTPTTTWLATLSLTDPSYTTVNLGIPGATAYDTCAMFDLMYGEQISQAPVITVLWGGINDVLHSLPARAIANSLRCMVQKAKARGSRVVLATEISARSNSGSSADLTRDALNTILRTEAYGWGVDNIADLATDPHLGTDGASSNTSCFPDNLHPGPSCEPYATAVMSDAINELLGSSQSSRHTTAAATYQEIAGDRFLDLTGTAAQTVSLPSCVGYSLPREIVNLGTAAGTVAAINSETLTGSTALAVNARAVFTPIPGAAATGGCRWERTQ
ncbi:MAG TPA: SGNH/GDSL hydrolase family protein [Edaphobacter sp.]|nr:SGNH/GDSL hydrolase family protein [Edaphobacter sp.]